MKKYMQLKEQASWIQYTYHMNSYKSGFTYCNI